MGICRVCRDDVSVIEQGRFANTGRGIADDLIRLRNALAHREQSTRLVCDPLDLVVVWMVAIGKQARRLMSRPMRSAVARGRDGRCG
jgi:hypothetical protein